MNGTGGVGYRVRGTGITRPAALYDHATRGDLIDFGGLLGGEN